MSVIKYSTNSLHSFLYFYNFFFDLEKRFFSIYFKYNKYILYFFLNDVFSQRRLFINFMSQDDFRYFLIYLFYKFNFIKSRSIFDFFFPGSFIYKYFNHWFFYFKFLSFFNRKFLLCHDFFLNVSMRFLTLNYTKSIVFRKDCFFFFDFDFLVFSFFRFFFFDFFDFGFLIYFKFFFLLYVYKFFFFFNKYNLSFFLDRFFFDFSNGIFSNPIFVNKNYDNKLRCLSLLEDKRFYVKKEFVLYYLKKRNKGFVLQKLFRVKSNFLFLLSFFRNFFHCFSNKLICLYILIICVCFFIFSAKFFNCFSFDNNSRKFFTLNLESIKYHFLYDFLFFKTLSSNRRPLFNFLSYEKFFKLFFFFNEKIFSFDFSLFNRFIVFFNNISKHYYNDFECLNLFYNFLFSRNAILFNNFTLNSNLTYGAELSCNFLLCYMTFLIRRVPLLKSFLVFFKKNLDIVKFFFFDNFVLNFNFLFRFFLVFFDFILLRQLTFFSGVLSFYSYKKFLSLMDTSTFNQFNKQTQMKNFRRFNSSNAFDFFIIRHFKNLSKGLYFDRFFKRKFLKPKLYFSSNVSFNKIFFKHNWPKRVSNVKTFNIVYKFNNISSRLNNTLKKDFYSLGKVVLNKDCTDFKVLFKVDEALSIISKDRFVYIEEELLFEFFNIFGAFSISSTSRDPFYYFFYKKDDYLFFLWLNYFFLLSKVFLVKGKFSFKNNFHFVFGFHDFSD